ncbi:HD domain-containing protein [Clostridium tarantellae]|uniref:HDIG domain-containing protein n=1 Tax=Clostridium tarantellae TaxID=39493 RepID=A0A6I1MG79_9CLOT|nr:HD domain-containing protein [Clostridium tarantellae]MPQ42190.1 HDIG domain-containing protein [Clostridium tarantellae]
MTDKELFLQIEKHLLEDANPSIYLRNILNNESFKNSIFSILYELKNIQQNPNYHPEGCVLTHTLLVVDEAAKIRKKANNKAAFMWAALFHDIGKAKTTLEIDDEIVDKNHDRVGAEMVRRILREVSTNNNFNNYVINLVKHHMTHFYVLNKSSYGEVHHMIYNANIYDLALLSYCDRIGKNIVNPTTKYKILKSINQFLNIISKRTYKNYSSLNIN